MLWQCYVDDHLICNVEGNHLTSAAILGQDGTVLAQSSNFPRPEEIDVINKEFEEAGHLAQTGLFLGGDKYVVVQGEAGALIRGRQGLGGVTIKKTTQALVFGIYDAPMTGGQCTWVVERLGDYFAEAGHLVTHLKVLQDQFQFKGSSLLQKHSSAPTKQNYTLAKN